MEGIPSESTPVDLFPQALPKIPSNASCLRYPRKLSVREIKIQRSEDGNKYAAITRHSRAKALWKTALSLISSCGDPWEKFHLQELPEETAKRYRYNAIRGKWIEDIVHVKIENSPFNRGAMRECFRAKKLSNFSHCSDWSHASNHVAKRYIEKVENHVYFDDVRLQMDAKLWGEEYSRQPSAPKKVDISQTCVLEFINRPEKPLYHLEHFIEGTYRKYNSNSGFVDDLSRNTPQVELSGTVAIPASRRDRYGIRRLVSENIDSSYDLRENANKHNNDTSSDFVDPSDFVESHSVPSPKLPFLPSRSPVSCRKNILQKTDQINDHNSNVVNNGKHSTKYNTNTTTTGNNINNNDARTNDLIFGPISLHNNSNDSGISFDGPSFGSVFKAQKSLISDPGCDPVCSDLDQSNSHLNSTENSQQLSKEAELIEFFRSHQAGHRSSSIAALHGADTVILGLPDPLESRAHGFALISAAASAGDRMAMVYLAEANYHGEYYSPDTSNDINNNNNNERKQEPDWLAAAHWYEMAAKVVTYDDATEDDEMNQGNPSFVKRSRSGFHALSEWPIYRLQGRLGEMYAKGGHGLVRDRAKAYELFESAAEGAIEAHEGRIAMEYYEQAGLLEEYAAIEFDGEIGEKTEEDK